MSSTIHDRASAGRPRLPRRRFLAATAAALGTSLAIPTIIPASALGADRKVAPSNRIGIGMIGLGRQAIAHNLPVFARAADAQVVALCDVDRWRLQFSKENPAAVAVAQRHQFDLDAMQGCFRKTGGSESVHVRFEGTEGWVCCWYGPDRLEAEPKSILTAEVKPEDFPFPLENEKRNFLNCVKTRQRTLEDAEVGHRSSSVAQLGYIACQLGRKLKWDPAAERFAGDDEANRLLTLPPGRAPWNV